MPAATITPRKALDAAQAAVVIAADAFYAAADRVTAYETDPAREIDGLVVPMRFRIRRNTTAKALRLATEAYVAARGAYLAAYPTTRLAQSLAA